MSEAAAADLLSDGELLSSSRLASTPLSGTSLSSPAPSDPRRRDKKRQVSVVAVAGCRDQHSLVGVMLGKGSRQIDGLRRHRLREAKESMAEHHDLQPICHRWSALQNRSHPLQGKIALQVAVNGMF